MSRNSRRRTSTHTEVQAPQAQAQVPQPASQVPQNNNNPFGISFVVPTEVIRLPSGGTFYKEGGTLYGKESLEIKQMTAKEEEIQ